MLPKKRPLPSHARTLNVPDAVRVFVVRHAEHLAPSATALSRRGSLQASAVADTLQCQGRVAAIFSSRRCTETAESIGVALGLTVTYDERLRNWDSGVLSGLSKAEVQAQLPEVYQKRFVERNPDFKVPQGESLKERYERVRKVLDDVIRLHAAEQVVVVTHGGVIDDMFRIACKLPLPQLTGLLKPYGCVSVLLFSGGKWRDEQWAGVDHLPQVVAESPTGGQLYLFPHQVAGSFPMFRGDRGLAAFTPTFYGVVEIDVNHILQRGGACGEDHTASNSKALASQSVADRRSPVDRLRAEAGRLGTDSASSVDMPSAPTVPAGSEDDALKPETSLAGDESARTPERPVRRIERDVNRPGNESTAPPCVSVGAEGGSPPRQPYVCAGDVGGADGGHRKRHRRCGGGSRAAPRSNPSLALFPPLSPESPAPAVAWASAAPSHSSGAHDAAASMRRKLDASVQNKTDRLEAFPVPSAWTVPEAESVILNSTGLMTSCMKFNLRFIQVGSLGSDTDHTVNVLPPSPTQPPPQV